MSVRSSSSTASRSASTSTCRSRAVSPLGYGISGTAALARRSLRVPDVRENPNYVRHRHPQIEVLSELAIPLLFKGKLIGVIDLESVELDAFTEEHEQMLSALASHIATAVENARLYERVLDEEFSFLSSPTAEGTGGETPTPGRGDNETRCGAPSLHKTRETSVGLEELQHLFLQKRPLHIHYIFSELN